MNHSRGDLLHYIRNEIILVPQAVRVIMGGWNKKQMKCEFTVDVDKL